ncbi:hypothetical protein T492DRAFT_833205 [Pavlovales sp. CCMP2436]|nr:hypothetical protein T492DRAFT_833205 [Pavlovales sp. CCMP2436]
MRNDSASRFAPWTRDGKFNSHGYASSPPGKGEKSASSACMTPDHVWSSLASWQNSLLTKPEREDDKRHHLHRESRKSLLAELLHRPRLHADAGFEVGAKKRREGVRVRRATEGLRVPPLGDLQVLKS